MLVAINTGVKIEINKLFHYSNKNFHRKIVFFLKRKIKKIAEDSRISDVCRKYNFSLV